MRSIKSIFAILSIFTCSKAFCVEQGRWADTTKHIVRTHHRKHKNWPETKYPVSNKLLYYNDCVFTNKYTVNQRLKKYPFNIAAKILAVSFDGTPEADIVIKIGDSIPKRRPHGLIFQNDTLDLSNLFEIKQLTAEQINRLTYIMFNTRVKVPNNFADPGSKCFFPRNAFIFYDKGGKVFDYLEVCFECRGYESKSNHLRLSSSGCNQQFDLAKKFLINTGIKFGTIITDPSKLN